MHSRFLLSCRRHAAALVLPLTLGCAGPLDPTTRPALQSGDGFVPQVSAGAETAAVGPAAQAGFYPLRVGNRWIHRQTTVLRIVPDFGEPPPALGRVSFVTRQIEGVETIGSREYITERLTTDDEGGGSSTWLVYYRQDAGGLYEFLPLRATPAATRRATGRTGERAALLDALVRPGSSTVAGRRFPATAAPYEVTRLRYPLEPKTRWTIWSPFGSLVTAEVVGVETLDLPPGRLRGVRIRIHADVLGPNDTYDLWYGPSGYLKSIVHLETDATDINGNVVGREIYEQEETLHNLRLVGAEVVALPPWVVTPGK